MLLFDTVAWRNTNQFAALTIMKHDHDLFGLKNHRNALYQTAQRDVGFVDRSYRIGGLDARSRRPARLGSDLEFLVVSVEGLALSASFFELSSKKLELAAFTVIPTHRFRNSKRHLANLPPFDIPTRAKAWARLSGVQSHRDVSIARGAAVVPTERRSISLRLSATPYIRGPLPRDGSKMLRVR